MIQCTQEHLLLCILYESCPVLPLHPLKNLPNSSKSSHAMAKKALIHSSSSSSPGPGRSGRLPLQPNDTRRPKAGFSKLLSRLCCSIVDYRADKLRCASHLRFLLRSSAIERFQPRSHMVIKTQERLLKRQVLS